MKKIFDMYSDPGHGWVKVPFKTLVDLNLVDRISCFSYYRNEHAYLEEDSDYSLLLEALLARGITPEFREHVSRTRPSKIRSYTCYTPYVVRNYFEQKKAIRAHGVAVYSSRT